MRGAACLPLRNTSNMKLDWRHVRTRGALLRRVLHHDALVVVLVAGTVLPGKVAAHTTPDSVTMQMVIATGEQ